MEYEGKRSGGERIRDSQSDSAKGTKKTGGTHLGVFFGGT